MHEGDAVGAQDCLYAGGRSDDMRAAGGEGGVEEEARVLLELAEVLGTACHGWLVVCCSVEAVRYFLLFGEGVGCW